MESKEFINFTINLSDGLMIVAVILGPILAVQVQKIIEHYKEDKKRKLQVFRDLMTTRASPLAYSHVSALNMIGLEFNGRKFSKVTNAWTTYIDHLNSYPDQNENLQNVWVEKKNDQLSDLLYEMGQSLGFSFDKVHIKKAAYVPKAYEDKALEENFIRHKVTDVLLGNHSIPMSITDIPVDSEALNTQKELHCLMKEHFEGKRSIPVTLDKEET